MKNHCDSETLKFLTEYQYTSLDETLDIYELCIANFRKDFRDIRHYSEISNILNRIFIDAVGPAYNDFYVVGIHELHVDNSKDGRISSVKQLFERVHEINKLWATVFPDVTRANNHNYPLPPALLYNRIVENLFEELSGPRVKFTSNI